MMENHENNNSIERRDFLKLVGITAAFAAVVPHIQMGSLLREIAPEEASKLQQQAAQEQICYRMLGWVGAAMGGNPAVVEVANNRIVRIRPLHFDSLYKPSDFNYDSWTIHSGNQTFTPPLKTLIPAMSIAYKKRAYSPNRVKYPLKRVDWDPTAGRNPQNRGISKFVRITWNEAITTIVSELNRIKATYGTTAIFSQADFHGEVKSVHGRPGATTRLLRMLGPVTLQYRDPDSWEGFYWGASHHWGMDMGMACGTMYPQDNVTTDILQNSDVVIFQGSDPETTPGGFNGELASLFCYWLKQAGKRSIYISPDLNYAGAVHADKWIPVLPNTDIAMQLAIAYTWITEGTYDRSYISTHTIGFDESSLPAGAPPNSSFKSYVMGLADGIPKTPKWASPICGVPSWTIKALARVWAANRTSTTHPNGGAYIRGPYSHEPGRMEVLLLAMQGVGKPGINQLEMFESWPTSAVVPSTMAAFQGLMFAPIPPILSKTQVTKGILNPPVSWYGSGGIGAAVTDQYQQYSYPTQGNSRIHMIWTETPCLTVCLNEGNRWVEAYRDSSIEFILAQHPWLEDDCLYADIVLPVTTNFENDIDICADAMGAAFNTVLLYNQCIPPIGESYSDVEICEMIAKGLDSTGAMYNTFIGGKTHQEWAQFGYQTSGIAPMISWADFQAKGYFVLPTDPAWNDPTKYPTGFSWYANLPEGAGLHTTSGKIEFYSQGLAAHFPNDTERPPVPHYVPYGPTHQESMATARAQQYPLLLVSNHPRWRLHAECDDVSWLREIETCKVMGPDGYQYEPVWINPVDAAKRGINNGDIVQMFNERGTVLGGAYITERIVPGAVYQDHGARLDMLADKLDRGGSNNLICPTANASANTGNSICVSGFLVEVTKADLASLQAQYPTAFARTYDASGSDYDSWVNSAAPSRRRE
jgi:molybdopterin guanine dinucleotide-containing S/N-oxide reductase-like protein